MPLISHNSNSNHFRLCLTKNLPFLTSTKFWHPAKNETIKIWHVLIVLQYKDPMGFQQCQEYHFQQIRFELEKHRDKLKYRNNIYCKKKAKKGIWKKWVRFLKYREFFVYRFDHQLIIFHFLFKPLNRTAIRYYEIISSLTV